MLRGNVTSGLYPQKGYPELIAASAEEDVDPALSLTQESVTQASILVISTPNDVIIFFFKRFLKRKPIIKRSPCKV